MAFLKEYFSLRGFRKRYLLVLFILLSGYVGYRSNFILADNMRIVMVVISVLVTLGVATYFSIAEYCEDKSYAGATIAFILLSLILFIPVSLTFGSSIPAGVTALSDSKATLVTEVTNKRRPARGCLLIVEVSESSDLLGGNLCVDKKEWKKYTVGEKIELVGKSTIFGLKVDSARILN